ncbi:MAG: hypothetical protein VB144_12630 [Clostridia bacterium]|nr:hypothetical protein [Clostridia bacterium]
MLVRVAPFASCLRDSGAMQERLGHCIAELSRIEGVQLQVDATSWAHAGRCDGWHVMASKGEPDATVLLILSGGTEAQALSFLAGANDPMLMLAHCADNALPAALEILAFANMQGRRGRIVQIRNGWQAELLSLLQLTAVRSRLGRARIGLIGTRDIEVMPQWEMEDRVKRAWGPTIVQMPVETLINAYRAVGEGEARAAAEDLAARAERVCEPSLDTMAGAGALYVALRGIVDSEGLDAVAVRCFDLLDTVHNTGCYALARLNEEGIPAACEADVLSCIGMLLVHEAADQPSFMANPSSIDPEGGVVTFAHCTIARTMTARHRLRSHFESGIGVGIAGELSPGRATVLRLGGRGLDGAFIAGGSIERSIPREDMCRTQAAVRFDFPGDARQMLRRPLGNHHLLIAGDWTGLLSEYCQR